MILAWTAMAMMENTLTLESSLSYYIRNKNKKNGKHSMYKPIFLFKKNVFFKWKQLSYQFNIKINDCKSRI